MMDGWNEQAYHNVLAVVLGSCALLYIWGMYRKKPKFLSPSMKFMTVGAIFMCISNLMEAVEISHSIYRHGLSGIPGIIGAISFILAGIFAVINLWQDRKKGKGNLAKPTP